nr:uncharacterized protein LOC128671298 [Plodia interpunctella]
MFFSFQLIVFLALSASLVASDNYCTTFKYPQNGPIYGRHVQIKPIVLRPNVQRYTLELQNNCPKTIALVLRVCDYDVAPSVYPVSFYEVHVQRNGQYRDVGMAFAEFYCDYVS